MRRAYFGPLMETFICLMIAMRVAAQPAGPIAQTKECIARGGLPNFFHKLATQRQIRIAYLGGSITAAPGGWRDLTFDWFRLNNPHTAFYQLNATVGGTGSLLGVFRLDEVLAQQPDLLFVEFAVNDENEASIDRRILAMEGIVRKTWAVLPYTDICFVYTTAKRFCDTMLLQHKRMPALLDHEKIAAHYGIPSIDLGLPVVRLYLQGKLALSADPAENAHTIVFWGKGDDYHPLIESGHPVYAETVVKYLEQMSKKAGVKKHDLPPPFRSDNWQASELIYPPQTALTGDWTKQPEDRKDSLGAVVPLLYRAGTGATMRFTFRGSGLGLYDIIGPGTGIIDVTIDGRTREVKRFDHNCHYWRRHAIFLDPLADTVHQVEIKVTGTAFDKSEAMRPGDDPAAYAPLDWYPIGILVVGKLYSNQ